MWLTFLKTILLLLVFWHFSSVNYYWTKTRHVLYLFDCISYHFENLLYYFSSAAIAMKKAIGIGIAENQNKTCLDWFWCISHWDSKYGIIFKGKKGKNTTYPLLSAPSFWLAWFSSWRLYWGTRQTCCSRPAIPEKWRRGPSLSPAGVLCPCVSCPASADSRRPAENVKWKCWIIWEFAECMWPTTCISYTSTSSKKHPKQGFYFGVKWHPIQGYRHDHFISYPNE